MLKNVFMTGANGCIGHYVIDECLKQEDLHLHLLIRNKNKLKINCHDNPRIHIYEEDFLNIETLEPVLKQMHYIIHIATSWGDDETTRKINIEKTKALFMLTDDSICERIIYFSTASILGKGNKPIIEAEKYGSGYVKTKYQAYQMVQTLPIKDKITTVFPTLVVGGNKQYPQSHITSGIYPNLKYIPYLLPFQIEGSFHFLHSADIAKVVVHLMRHEYDKNEYVLGQNFVELKDALSVLAGVFAIRQWFQIKVSHKVIFLLATLFRIKIGPWERHCIESSHMIFDTVKPEDFGLRSEFPTFESVLRDIKSWSKA
jgi:nucleoside-diphosphate-sugar epimerase